MSHGSHSGYSSQMDHSMPGHDMPGHEMPEMCSMNMLFTWDWRNTCVVYKWWHVKTFPQFLLTLLAIVILASGYEYTKYIFAKWERGSGTIGAASVPLVNNSSSAASPRAKWSKSLIYGFQVGYSFMLMLVFMTYNGWYMIATVVGAVLGHHFWGQELPQLRTMACH